MIAVIDGGAPRELEVWLASLGHTPLRLPPHPALPAPISSHPDMLLFFSPGAILCTQSYAKIAQRELEAISSAAECPIRSIPEEYGAQYPRDVLLNAACVGETVFCLPQATTAAIREDSRFSVCPVKQGYAKCSVIPVGAHALMTADASIERTARAVDMDVLMLCTGHIALSGYDYGFPGGAASYAPYGGTDEILFCGPLSRYPSGEEMRRFCRAHGFSLRACTELSPIDVGTVFLI